MVSLSSLFSSKKKARRAPSPPRDPALTNTNATTTTTTEPTRQTSRPSSPTRSRQTARPLSLRSKTNPKPYDNALRRASSELSRRRSKGQDSKSGTTELPTLGWVLPGVNAQSREADSLGLEGMGRPPQLKESEVLALQRQRYTPEEVGQAWRWFGQALRETDLESVGIMLRGKLQTDTRVQHHLLSLFLLSVHPDCATEFPSITGHYTGSETNAESVPKDKWIERLQSLIKDTACPGDFADVLKFITRRLTSTPPSTTAGTTTNITSRPPLDVSVYTQFVQAEREASFPLNAYDTLFVSRLHSTISAYLEEIFDVWAAIASRADINTMTGGRISQLLGYWVWGSQHSTKQGELTWKELYDAWSASGRRTEHLFYAWIRNQSTKQQLPMRLLQLVEKYPFGEVTETSELLPPPPPSSFTRKTLHISIISPIPIDNDITPREALNLSLKVDSHDAKTDTPLWFTVQPSLVSGEEAIENSVANDIKDFRGEFPRMAVDMPPPKEEPKTPTVEQEPLYRPFSAISSAARPSARRRRSQSIGDLSETRLNALKSAQDGNGQQSAQGTSPTRLNKQTLIGMLNSAAGNPTWDSFETSGFTQTPDPDVTLSLGQPSKILPEISVAKPAPANWASFGKAGFVESPNPDPALSPSRQAVSLPPVSPRGVSFESPRSKRDGPVNLPSKPKLAEYTRAGEEVRDIDDLFMSFVQDGQLDASTTASWPRFALVRLQTPVIQSEGDEKSEVDWLLITLEHRPPPTSPDVNTQERSSSPAASTSSKLGGTFGMFLRSSSFGQKSGSRRSIFGSGNRSTHKWAASTSALPTLTESASSGRIEPADPNSAVSAALTEYTITEMGEMVIIDPATVQDLEERFDPSRESKPTHWVYRAEGGAHLIFAYQGSSPTYFRRVLRVRKRTSKGELADDQRAIWRDEILPKLVPSELLLSSKSVTLESAWLRTLLEKAEKSRPQVRKQEGGLLSTAVEGDVQASIMDDTIAAKPRKGETTLCIEIKPKWGFVPSADHVQPAEAKDVKSQVSRFRMHYHLRNPESKTTVYDPLDLFSGGETQITKALEALWTMWEDKDATKNNWRVYVDGKAVGPKEADRIPTVKKDGSLATRTAPLIVPTLQQSAALHKIKTLQSTLDPVDISTIAQKFKEAYPDAEVFDPKLMSEPSSDDIKIFVDKYLANPQGSDSWTLGETMMAYSLSAIFKDCSVFLRLPLSKVSGEWTVKPGTGKVKVIDLDLKPLSSMRHWYDLDEQIWRHWLETHPTSAAVPAATGSADTEYGLAPPIQIQETHSEREDDTAASSRAIFAPTPEGSGLSTPTAIPSDDVMLAATGLDRSDARVLATSPSRNTFGEPDRREVLRELSPMQSVSLSDALAITPSNTVFINVAATDDVVEPSLPDLPEEMHRSAPATTQASNKIEGQDELPLPKPESRLDAEPRSKRSTAPQPEEVAQPKMLASTVDESKVKQTPIPTPAANFLQQVDYDNISEHTYAVTADGLAAEAGTTAIFAATHDDAKPNASEPVVEAPVEATAPQDESASAHVQSTAPPMEKTGSALLGAPSPAISGASTPLQEFHTPIGEVSEPFVPEALRIPSTPPVRHEEPGEVTPTRETILSCGSEPNIQDMSNIPKIDEFGSVAGLAHDHSFSRRTFGEEDFEHRNHQTSGSATGLGVTTGGVAVAGMGAGLVAHHELAEPSKEELDVKAPEPEITTIPVNVEEEQHQTEESASAPVVDSSNAPRQIAQSHQGVDIEETTAAPVGETVQPGEPVVTEKENQVDEVIPKEAVGEPATQATEEVTPNREHVAEEQPAQEDIQPQAKPPHQEGPVVPAHHESESTQEELIHDPAHETGSIQQPTAQETEPTAAEEASAIAQGETSHESTDKAPVEQPSQEHAPEAKSVPEPAQHGQAFSEHPGVTPSPGDVVAEEPQVSDQSISAESQQSEVDNSHDQLDTAPFQSRMPVSDRLISVSARDENESILDPASAWSGHHQRDSSFDLGGKMSQSGEGKGYEGVYDDMGHEGMNTGESLQSLRSIENVQHQDQDERGQLTPLASTPALPAVPEDAASEIPASESQSSQAQAAPRDVAFPASTPGASVPSHPSFGLDSSYSITPAHEPIDDIADAEASFPSQRAREASQEPETSFDPGMVSYQDRSLSHSILSEGDETSPSIHPNQVSHGDGLQSVVEVPEHSGEYDDSVAHGNVSAQSLPTGESQDRLTVSSSFGNVWLEHAEDKSEGLSDGYSGRTEGTSLDTPRIGDINAFPSVPELPTGSSSHSLDPLVPEIESKVLRDMATPRLNQLGEPHTSQPGASSE